MSQNLSQEELQLRRQRQLESELEIERLRLERLASKDTQQEVFQREMADRFIQASLLGISQVVTQQNIKFLFKLQVVTVLSALAVSMALADNNLRLVILLGIVLPCLTLPKNTPTRFITDLATVTIVVLISYVLVKDLATWCLLAFMVLTVPVIVYVILGAIIYPTYLYIKFRRMKDYDIEH